MSTVPVHLTEASHPDVRCYVDADPVVPFGRPEVVIPDEHHLHPTLPLLRLIPAVTTTDW